MILEIVYLLKVLKAAIKGSVDCPALYLSYFHFKGPDIPCIIIISSFNLHYEMPESFYRLLTIADKQPFDCMTFVWKS